MKNGFRVVSALALVASVGVALVAIGCETSTSGTLPASTDAGDAAADVEATDASSTDAVADGSSDASGNSDAGVDAGPTLPPLCETYGIDVDAGGGDRYRNIAEGVFYDSDGVFGRCEFGDTGADCSTKPPAPPAHHFCSLLSPAPDEPACLGWELKAITGCQQPNGLGPYVYNQTAQDVSGTPCNPAPADGGVDQVHLGFWSPAKVQGGITDSDVELMISLIRAKALASGYAAADADRLVDLLRARKDTAKTSNAAGYSRIQSGCDAGL